MSPTLSPVLILAPRVLLGDVEEQLLLSTGTVSKSVKFRTSKFKGQLLVGARVHGHGGDVVRAQQRRR